jgi:hypothetical protein
METTRPRMYLAAPRQTGPLIFADFEGSEEADRH